MTVYLDTSAAAKVLVQEEESAALAAQLDTHARAGVGVVSNVLLETELRRFAGRAGRPQEVVSELLQDVDLVVPDRALFRAAGVLPGARLRSLDALHLATALRVGADEVVTYDVRMAEAARSLGLTVRAPS